MSEAAAAPTSAAPTSAAPANDNANPDRQAQPANDNAKPWEAWDEDQRKHAREFALNETETRKVNGKDVTKTRAEWARYTQQLEGINDKHALTVEEKKQLEAKWARAQRALSNPRDLLEFLVENGGERGLSLFDEAQQELARLRGMTPEQRAEMAQREEIERKAQEFERLQKEQAEQAENQKYEADMTRHAQKIDAAYGKIGWTPSENIAPVADLIATTLLSQAISNNDTSMTYTKVATAVRDITADIAREHIASLKPAELQKLLGPQVQSLMGQAATDLQSQMPRAVPPRDPTGKFTSQQQQPKVQVYSPGVGQFSRLLRS